MCVLLPSSSIFLHLQDICLDRDFLVKGKGRRVLSAFVYQPAFACDSKGSNGSKRQALFTSFIVTVVGYFSVFDCLLDAESSSVNESESKGLVPQ